MALRIAFDLDGVLADMDSALDRHARMLFSDALPANPERPAMPNGSSKVALNLSTKQQQLLWQHVHSIQNFWAGLAEIEPGAVARLAAVAAEKRWEVIFLTRRPETAGATAQMQSQQWLESKGFRLPSVFVVQGSRGRIASALGLDIVVDDRIENCLDVVVDSHARAILVWREDEQRLPATARRLGIAAVRSISECLDAIVHADSIPTGRGRLVVRVMRALGLKESAGV